MSIIDKVQTLKTIFMVIDKVVEVIIKCVDVVLGASDVKA